MRGELRVTPHESPVAIYCEFGNHTEIVMKQTNVGPEFGAVRWQGHCRAIVVQFRYLRNTLHRCYLVQVVVSPYNSRQNLSIIRCK